MLIMSRMLKFIEGLESLKKNKTIFNYMFFANQITSTSKVRSYRLRSAKFKDNMLGAVVPLWMRHSFLVLWGSGDLFTNHLNKRLFLREVVNSLQYS